MLQTESTPTEALCVLLDYGNHVSELCFVNLATDRMGHTLVICPYDSYEQHLAATQLATLSGSDVLHLQKP